MSRPLVNAFAPSDCESSFRLAVRVQPDLAGIGPERLAELLP